MLTGHELRKLFIEKEDYYYKKYGINFIEVGEVDKGGKWVPMTWFHVGIRIDTVGYPVYWSPRYGVVSKEKVLEDSL